jgi:PAS domain S-box-containing protein
MQHCEIVALLRWTEPPLSSIERAPGERRPTADGERLALALAAARLGVWEWDLASDRVNWSPECYAIMGESRPVGHLADVQALVHPEDLPGVMASARRALDDKTWFAAEFRLRPRDGEVAWIRAQGRGLYDASGPIALLGSLVDVTERVQGEAAREILALVLETVGHGVLYIEPGGTIRFTNRALDAMFGYDRGELVGKPVSILNAGTAEENERTAREIMGIVESRGKWTGDLRNRRKDGSLIETRSTVTAARTAGERLLVTVQEDVTEQRRAASALQVAHSQLRDLSRHVLGLQEAERRHLSRELHDEVGQSLTAIKLGLALVTPADPRAERQRAELQATLDGLIERVRRISFELRPAILDDLGLVPALRFFLREQGARAGFHAELASSLADDDVVPASLATVCFRIAQEAVTNVVRHAAARNVLVSLSATSESLTLVVRDDGRGFDPCVAERQAPSSLGLLGMRERALMRSGTVAIESAPGRGTEVRVVFPLAPATATGARP